MKLDEFIEVKMEEIKRFKYFWHHSMLQEPKDFPDQLSEPEWEGKLAEYLEDCDDDN
jgi:hypothetical protein